MYMQHLNRVNNISGYSPQIVFLFLFPHFWFFTDSAKWKEIKKKKFLAGSMLILNFNSFNTMKILIFLFDERNQFNYSHCNWNYLISLNRNFVLIEFFYSKLDIYFNLFLVNYFEKCYTKIFIVIIANS